MRAGDAAAFITIAAMRSRISAVSRKRWRAITTRLRSRLITSMRSTIAATCFAAIGRHQEALADYAKVLALRPRHVSALNRQGNAFAALRRPNEALAAYDAALAIESGQRRNAQQSQRDAAELGRSRRLCEAARGAGGEIPDTPTRSTIAATPCSRSAGRRSLHKLSGRAGDRAAARGCAQQSRPDVGLGRTRHAEALTKFDAALAIEPNDIGALHNRANALAVLGVFEQALTPCDKCWPKIRLTPMRSISAASCSPNCAGFPRRR